MRGVAAGGAHPVRAGARDEDGRDRLPEREAGGDVARRRLAGQHRRLLLLGRLRVISSTEVGNSSFSSSARDAGEHGVFGRIGWQIAGRDQRLDAAIDAATATGRL